MILASAAAMLENMSWPEGRSAVPINRVLEKGLKFSLKGGWGVHLFFKTGGLKSGLFQHRRPLKQQLRCETATDHMTSSNLSQQLCSLNVIYWTDYRKQGAEDSFLNMHRWCSNHFTELNTWYIHPVVTEACSMHHINQTCS